MGWRPSGAIAMVTARLTRPLKIVNHPQRSRAPNSSWVAGPLAAEGTVMTPQTLRIFGATMAVEEVADGVQMRGRSASHHPRDRTPTVSDAPRASTAIP
jgi:hypothetical protein